MSDSKTPLSSAAIASVSKPNTAFRELIISSRDRDLNDTKQMPTNFVIESAKVTSLCLVRVRSIRLEMANFDSGYKATSYVKLNLGQLGTELNTSVVTSGVKFAFSVQTRSIDEERTICTVIPRPLFEWTGSLGKAPSITDIKVAVVDRDGKLVKPVGRVSFGLLVEVFI
jgi:hypothetical protein